MEDLRVLTWNVLADSYIRPEYYAHLNGLPDPTARRAAVVGVLAEASDNVDVLVLQEVEDHVACAVRARLDGWQVLSTLRPTKREGSLVAVRPGLWAHLSRVALSPDRVCARATLETTSGLVSILGVHLAWSDQPAASHPGVAQARELMELAPPGPVVVAGDFNDEPSGVVLDVFTAAGFTDVPVPHPTAVVNSDRQTIIDHVTTRGLGPATAEVLVEAARPLPDDVFPSDHVPVLATIKLRT
jgi:endonuclease/exonuclease/phosphatase family metal-dependent hydrolase